MLMFCAGMVGFCLTGDLFNLFVLFELMSVSAYALTGYRIEARGPIQGALNFAITNSVGAFMTLSGIALLYGRTGALNMAQVGEALSGQPTDELVVGAFVLITIGFLVKAAAVPFHFWLSDAHAVAPAPVCVLLSSVMVQVGLYAVARVYWTVFSGAVPASNDAFVTALVVFGAVTAVVGAVMCFAQRHLKRLLAFSTISHTGLFLIGIGLLDARGTSAAAVFVLAHAFVKGALFVLVGIVADRCGRVDEPTLQGKARDLRLTGVLFALGGLALASLPPFGPFLGKALVEEGAAEHGFWWVAPLSVLVSALAGGAVLRAAGRVFLGLGPGDEPAAAGVERPAEEEPERFGSGRDRPGVMLALAFALIAAGLVVGVLPGLDDGTSRASARFVDRPAYAAAVMDARPERALAAPSSPGPEWPAYAYGAGSIAIALALAGAALSRDRLRRAIPARTRALVGRPIAILHAIHDGHVGDYVAWLMVGAAVLATVFTVTIR
jgi:multicomponent Na+:H+ antiporter subunit D